MSTGKHYFVEENKNGKFAVRAKGSNRASLLLDPQEETIRAAKPFDPEDHPDVERVQKRSKGPDNWGSAS